MSNISFAYINAILSDAAYIDIPNGVIRERDLKPDAPLSTRMTPPLARFIADNFEVISNKLGNDFTNSGFDAIVWKGRLTTNPTLCVFLKP